MRSERELLTELPWAVDLTFSGDTWHGPLLIVTFCIGIDGNLGLVRWQIVSTAPRAPERTTAAAPGAVGRYVEIEGELALALPYLRLDGVLDVEPPSVRRAEFRASGIHDDETIARCRSALGDGRRVVVRGEVRAPGNLLSAVTITDASGPLDL